MNFLRCKICKRKFKVDTLENREIAKLINENSDIPNISKQDLLEVAFNNLATHYQIYHEEYYEEKIQRLNLIA